MHVIVAWATVISNGHLQMKSTVYTEGSDEHKKGFSVKIKLSVVEKKKKKNYIFLAEKENSKNHRHPTSDRFRTNIKQLITLKLQLHSYSCRSRKMDHFP
jgi:hypothetical protein